VSYFTVQEVNEDKIDDKSNYLPTGKIIIDSMDVMDAEAIKSDADGTSAVSMLQNYS